MGRRANDYDYSDYSGGGSGSLSSAPSVHQRHKYRISKHRGDRKYRRRVPKAVDPSLPRGFVTQPGHRRYKLVRQKPIQNVRYMERFKRAQRAGKTSSQDDRKRKKRYVRVRKPGMLIRDTVRFDSDESDHAPKKRGRKRGSSDEWYKPISSALDFITGGNDDEGSSASEVVVMGDDPKYYARSDSSDSYAYQTDSESSHGPRPANGPNLPTGFFHFNMLPDHAEFVEGKPPIIDVEQRRFRNENLLRRVYAVIDILTYFTVPVLITLDGDWLKMGISTHALMMMQTLLHICGLGVAGILSYVMYLQTGSLFGTGFTFQTKPMDVLKVAMYGSPIGFAKLGLVIWSVSLFPPQGKRKHAGIFLLLALTLVASYVFLAKSVYPRLAMFYENLPFSKSSFATPLHAYFVNSSDQWVGTPYERYRAPLPTKIDFADVTSVGLGMAPTRIRFKMKSTDGAHSSLIESDGSMTITDICLFVVMDTRTPCLVEASPDGQAVEFTRVAIPLKPRLPSLPAEEGFMAKCIDIMSRSPDGVYSGLSGEDLNAFLEELASARPDLYFAAQLTGKALVEFDNNRKGENDKRIPKLRPAGHANEQVANELFADDRV